MEWSELTHDIVTRVDPKILPWALLSAALLVILVWGGRWLIRQLIGALENTGEGAKSVAATLESMEAHTTSAVSSVKAELTELREEMRRTREAARCRHPEQ